MHAEFISEDEPNAQAMLRDDKMVSQYFEVSDYLYLETKFGSLGACQQSTDYTLQHSVSVFLPLLLLLQ
jgi:hypothetical protein